MVKLTYHGHSVFEIFSQNHDIVIDPFFNGNSHAKVKPSDVKADYIILTHAHGDHIGDTLEIAKKNNSTVIAVNELGNYLFRKKDAKHIIFISAADLTSRLAGSNLQLPITVLQQRTGVYMGEPAGVVISIDGKNIYHAGDTGLFLDMKLIGEITPLDVAIVPIGDNFTMGIDDAVKAIEFLNPKLAIPMHYNTWDIIEADPVEFKRKVESIGKKCTVIPFGDSIEI